MPLTRDQIAPLLAESYRGEAAVWAVIEKVVFPSYAQSLKRIVRPGLGDTRESMVSDTIAELARRVIERRGYPAPNKDDCAGWLAQVLGNCARDLMRARDRLAARHEALDGERTDDTRVADHEPPVAAPTERMKAIREALAAHSALYVLGFFCWANPTAIDRDMLEAAAATPTRGRKSTTTGIARSIDETLRLLRRHERELREGARQNAAAQERLGWILRSTTEDFDAWRADRRGVKTAREALAKWYQRARKEIAKIARPSTEEDD